MGCGDVNRNWKGGYKMLLARNVRGRKVGKRGECVQGTKGVKWTVELIDVRESKDATRTAVLS